MSPVNFKTFRYYLCPQRISKRSVGPVVMYYMLTVEMAISAVFIPWFQLWGARNLLSCLPPHKSEFAFVLVKQSGSTLKRANQQVLACQGVLSASVPAQKKAVGNQGELLINSFFGTSHLHSQDEFSWIFAQTSTVWRTKNAKRGPRSSTIL